MQFSVAFPDTHNTEICVRNTQEQHNFLEAHCNLWDWGDFGSIIVQRSQVLLHICGSLLPYMPKGGNGEKDGEPENEEPTSSDLAC